VLVVVAVLLIVTMEAIPSASLVEVVVDVVEFMVVLVVVGTFTTELVVIGTLAIMVVAIPILMVVMVVVVLEIGSMLVVAASETIATDVVAAPVGSVVVLEVTEMFIAASSREGPLVEAGGITATAVVVYSTAVVLVSAATPKTASAVHVSSQNTTHLSLTLLSMTVKSSSRPASDALLLRDEQHACTTTGKNFQ